MSRYKFPSVSSGSDGKNVNELLGILATVPSAWKSGNANLANMTDGDIATLNTGVVAGYADNKNYAFDLLSLKAINMIEVIMGACGGQPIYIFYGINAPTYTSGLPNNMSSQVAYYSIANSRFGVVVQLAAIRYIVINYTSPAGDATYETKEVFAWS
jgi:hypothetical protein